MVAALGRSRLPLARRCCLEPTHAPHTHCQACPGTCCKHWLLRKHLRATPAPHRLTSLPVAATAAPASFKGVRSLCVCGAGPPVSLSAPSAPLLWSAVRSRHGSAPRCPRPPPSNHPTAVVAAAYFSLLTLSLSPSVFDAACPLRLRDTLPTTTRGLVAPFHIPSPLALSSLSPSLTFSSVAYHRPPLPFPSPGACPAVKR